MAKRSNGWRDGGDWESPDLSLRLVWWLAGAVIALLVVAVWLVVRVVA